MKYVIIGSKETNEHKVLRDFDQYYEGVVIHPLWSFFYQPAHREQGGVTLMTTPIFKKSCNHI